MTDRFSPRDILNAHFKGLKNRDYTQERPRGTADVLARIVLYLLPLTAGLVAYFSSATVAGPDGLIEASGILLGAFFVGFTQVASWRDRFTARLRDVGELEVHSRDSLDEAVAHLFMAVYANVALLITIVIGSNFANDSGKLDGGLAALVVALGTYLLLLLLMILPKLYTAYATVNELDDEMSGLSR